MQQIDKQAIWGEGLAVEWKLKMIGAYLCFIEGGDLPLLTGDSLATLHIFHTISARNQEICIFCAEILFRFLNEIGSSSLFLIAAIKSLYN